MIDEPSSEYKERIAALDNVVRHCITVSQKCAGINSPTGAHFYASVLFTSLCTRAVSLATLAPYSPWSQKLIEHWDYASIAGMVRSILEIRLAFFYLCVEQCEADEWQCRWNLFNLHDCMSRKSLFEHMQNSAEQGMEFENQVNELRNQLQENSFFVNIPLKQRNKFLNGGNAYLYPMEDIAVRSGVDLHTFRWLYRFFSSHVHGLPMSFYRMGEQERGRGIHSDVEESYTSLCLSFAVSLLVGARDDMEKLFIEIQRE